MRSDDKHGDTICMSSCPPRYVRHGGHCVPAPVRCVFQHGMGLTHHSRSHKYIPAGHFILSSESGGQWGDDITRDLINSNLCTETIFVSQNTISEMQGWNSRSLHKGLCAALTGRISIDEMGTNDNPTMWTVDDVDGQTGIKRFPDKMGKWAPNTLLFAYSMGSPITGGALWNGVCEKADDSSFFATQGAWLGSDLSNLEAAACFGWRRKNDFRQHLFHCQQHFECEANNWGDHCDSGKSLTQPCTHMEVIEPHKATIEDYGCDESFYMVRMAKWMRDNNQVDGNVCGEAGWQGDCTGQPINQCWMEAYAYPLKTPGDSLLSKWSCDVFRTRQSTGDLTRGLTHYRATSR